MSEPTKLTCANCGSDDLWAWYPEPVRQTIEVVLAESGEVTYDYTGVTDTGDDSGPDDSYACGSCGKYTETIEELVGQPRPPLLGRALSEWDALGLLFPNDEPTPDDDFPSGADFIEAVCEHFGFTRESYVRYCQQAREQRELRAQIEARS